jgi:hypothetical protein
MRISGRTLIFSIIIGAIILGGCAIVFFLTSQRLTQTGAAPPPNNSSIEPGEVQATAPLPSELPTSESLEVTAQPTLPERRRLTIEFPPRMRAGDSDLVRLTLEVDELGNITPTAEIGGNVITGEVVEIPNLYESHTVIAETRFDIAGMQVRPAELVSESLLPGSSVTFYWSIRSPEVGVYRGTIWLYLRFVDKSNGAESRKTISAQIVEIEAVNLFGLSGNLARTTGVVGSVVGTVIGFPFLEDIIKFVFRRRKQQNKQI